MELVVITGQSGAGKSQAKKVYEDMGYYCVDNMPPALLINFVDLMIESTEQFQKIAIVIDIRGGEFFNEIQSNIKKLGRKNVNCKIIFFEAENSVILKRYKEIRRGHPLDTSRRIEDCIEDEKKLLAEIKMNSNFTVDTTNLNHSELKQEIYSIMNDENYDDEMSISILSFGHKRGLPLDADFVFDLRFLPNPYYIENLRSLTGNDKRVRDYVMSFDDSREYFKSISELIQWSIPKFKKEGRNQLVIAFGCTGGKHRSVSFANELGRLLKNEENLVNIIHRDAKK